MAALGAFISLRIPKVSSSLSLLGLVAVSSLADGWFSSSWLWAGGFSETSGKSVFSFGGVEWLPGGR